MKNLLLAAALLTATCSFGQDTLKVKKGDKPKTEHRKKGENKNDEHRKKGEHRNGEHRNHHEKTKG